MDTLLAAVDFPSFVADLIQGLFGAIVNASVKQMEAYAALITAVSLSVDQFVQANITEDFSATCAGERVPECRLLGRRRHAAPEAPRACPLAEPDDAGRRHRTA